MYIIGIIIGLYFKISIAFLCVILLVILAVWESCYLILNFKCIKNKFKLKKCIKHSIFLLFNFSQNANKFFRIDPLKSLLPTGMLNSPELLNLI